MKNIDRKEAIIKKIDKIYKKGYLPSRTKENYENLHTEMVNCFGHACFNLSNESLKKLYPCKDELFSFFRDFGSCGVRNYFNEVKDRITSVGLKIERSSITENIKNNQWKIAYFVMNDAFSGTDIHFMIQGNDGKWTSKVGKKPDLEVYDELPEVYHEKYDLMGVYIITNPYIKIKDEEMEM